MGPFLIAISYFFWSSCHSGDSVWGGSGRTGWRKKQKRACYSLEMQNCIKVFWGMHQAIVLSRNIHIANAYPRPRKKKFASVSSTHGFLKSHLAVCFFLIFFFVLFCFVLFASGKILVYFNQLVLACTISIWNKDLQGNPKPRVSPDWPGPKPVLGRGTLLRIFSGRVGAGNFISGRSGSGYFLPGYETFSPGVVGINLPFIPKLRK